MNVIEIGRFRGRLRKGIIEYVKPVVARHNRRDMARSVRTNAGIRV